MKKKQIPFDKVGAKKKKRREKGGARLEEETKRQKKGEKKKATQPEDCFAEGMTRGERKDKRSTTAELATRKLKRIGRVVSLYVLSSMFIARVSRCCNAIPLPIPETLLQENTTLSIRLSV